MAKQEQVKYTPPKESSSQMSAEEAATEMAQAAKAQKAQRKAGELATDKLAKIDEVLEEIDGVLEENASEFIEAFHQKGGE